MNTNETWLMPVSKKTLSRVVTDKITEALANGQLKPGDYLPSEGQLAENLNVGKSSVREATKMLEAVGVVEIIKGRGCRIRTTIDGCAESAGISVDFAEQHKPRETGRIPQGY